jgi:chemotaxis protein methyltransferase CheR
MNQIVIGISELKNLILNIKTNKGIDFSDYAYSSLKRRIESFMLQFHFKNIDELIHKINKDEYFFDLFLEAILVDTTELFRDPEFWQALKTFVLKRMSTADKIKILIPECNSGEELFSLLIVLKQLELIEKTNILVTSLCTPNVKRIKNAAIEIKKMDANSANFERFDENGNIFDFFNERGSAVKLDSDLLKNVTVEKHNLFNEKLTRDYDLILYRNKTIYYNQQLKSEAFKILSGSLKTGGYIAVGIKEPFEYTETGKTFSVYNESEKIYKKQ